MLTSYFYFQFDPDLVLVSAGFDSALGDPKVKFFLKTFVHYNYNKTILKDKNSLMKSLLAIFGTLIRTRAWNQKLPKTWIYKYQTDGRTDG